MIVFKQKGSFDKTERFLKNVSNVNYRSVLEKYGQEGVNALSSATPVDSGITASSWYYEIEESKGRYTIYWNNSNVVDGVPIALIIQYGHGTPSGTYVEGRDYINPALKPIFKKLADDAWREVTKV